MVAKYVIDKSYIEKERMFILKLEGQEMIATITEDLVKSLHAMIGDEQNHFVTVIDWERRISVEMRCLT